MTYCGHRGCSACRICDALRGGGETNNQLHIDFLGLIWVEGEAGAPPSCCCDERTLDRSPVNPRKRPFTEFTQSDAHTFGTRPSADSTTQEGEGRDLNPQPQSGEAGKRTV